MGEVITIGLDIAKLVFQVHGVDEIGAVVIRKRVSRAKMLEFFGSLKPCLIGIEACPAAHHWGRELQALGHTVKLMPPAYVKAYVKRSKNDANDAAAICEAVTRPSMRFVAIKTKDQQAALMLHRARQLLVRQRTMLSNAIRGHLAELGIVSAKGRQGTGALLEIIAAGDGRVPPVARGVLDVLARQYNALGTELGSIDRSILAWHRSCEASRRLEEIPGIGPVVATALVAEIGDWKAFGSGRSLAAWIGLVPRQQSTGGKDRLGGITKQGNRYLRWLLVVGAMAVIRYAQKHGTLKRPWLGRLMARRPTKVAAVALANKIARMAWAIIVHGERYREPASLLAA